MRFRKEQSLSPTTGLPYCICIDRQGDDLKCLAHFPAAPRTAIDIDRVVGIVESHSGKMDMDAPGSQVVEAILASIVTQVAALRPSTVEGKASVPVKVTPEGVWLTFRTETGQATIDLEDYARKRGHVVGEVISTWCAALRGQREKTK